MDAKRVHELDLHAKKLSKIEGVEKYKFLRSLDVSCNELTKIQGLGANKDIRELKLYGNKITVIEGLEKLSELCVLLLQHNRISSVGNGLSSLKKLRQLRLDNNQLTKLSHSDLVSCGSHMTQLDLSHNQLTTLQGLGSLSNLEELKLASNKLTCPPDLARCRRLQELDLSDNPLSKELLSPALKHLAQLKILHLDKIDLCDLSPLPKLPSLEALHMAHNRLSMLSEITRLYTCLEVLDVRWNSLASLEAVSSVKSLSNLCEVMLEGNRFCEESNNYRKDVHSAVPSLETIDGVTVSLLSSNLPAPLQMRPLTPSSLGPTLRQMDQHFMEAELQLQGLEGEMAARFDLTRAKMAAAVRESEEITIKHREICETPKVEVLYRNGTDDVERTHDVAADSSDSTAVDGVRPSRPATRCGSRAKLTEALILADLYSDHNQPT